MPSPSVPATSLLDELENDLPTVAAGAALELDHLVLNRSRGFSAVQRLVDVIRSAVTDVNQPAVPDSLLNPATAVALGKALAEGEDAGPETTARLSDLVKQAAKFQDRLAAVAAHPDLASAAEKEKLRNVCIALSRQAVAVESVARYRRNHPFREHF